MPRPPHGALAEAARRGCPAAWRLWWVPLLLIGVLLAPASAAPSQDNERQARLAELERLRARIATLRADLDAIRSRHDAVRTELREIERRIGRLVSSLKELDAQLGQRRARLQALKREQAGHERELAAQRALLARQVRAAYTTGRQEYLKLLLNQEDPGALGRVVTYYDYLSRARVARIATVNDTLARLETVAQAISSESAALEALRAEQGRDRQALESTYAERAAVVARLQQDMQSQGAELARMLENERQLEQLLLALKEALADIPAEPGHRRPFAKLKGRMAWPTKGRVDRLFGKPREAGQLVWNGVMIDAAEGGTVRAVSHGRVAFADWLRGYGLLLIIDHGDGYMSLYGHNQSLFKETGDWVEEGEAVASVGRSGGQAKPGLYFEIRHQGRPVNPTAWCRVDARG